MVVWNILPPELDGARFRRQSSSHYNGEMAVLKPFGRLAAVGRLPSEDGSMFAPAEAVRFLDDAHRTRASYQNIPAAIGPQTVAEAYDVQEALCARWAERLGSVAGLKIATTTKVMQQLMGIDHPCGGMIFSSRVHRSPANIRKADYVNVRIECELAVKLGRTLSPAPRAYTRDSVRPAVSDIMAAFELIEDRHANYKTCKALSLIADNAWNGGIVIAAPKPLPSSLELDGIAGRLSRNGKLEASGQTDDPLGALAWLANLAIERGRPIESGMLVITGSVVTTVDIAPGERLDFGLDGVGEASLSAT
jgi:2-keto-4-pentenoate hydratase